MRISDWSSDVCSSDLELATDIESPHAKRRIFSPTLLRIIIESEKLEGIGMGNAFFAMISGNQRGALGEESDARRLVAIKDRALTSLAVRHSLFEIGFERSEARRVGKECVSSCRYGWLP